MDAIFDSTAPKKAANLSINSDLLAKSKAAKINLSATLERALEGELAKSAADRWKVENRQAIEAYNEMLARRDNFADEFRSF